MELKASVSFSQGGGNLTLTGLGGYDPYDTVFNVETSGRATAPLGAR